MTLLSQHSTNKPDFSQWAIDYLNRATEAYHQGDYQEALENCNLSIDANAANPEIYRIRGLVWYKLKNMEKASQDMQKAVSLISNKSQEPKKTSRSILHLFW